MNVSQLITVMSKELVTTDHLYDQYRIRLQDQHRVKFSYDHIGKHKT